MASWPTPVFLILCFDGFDDLNQVIGIKQKAGEAFFRATLEDSKDCFAEEREWRLPGAPIPSILPSRTSKNTTFPS